MSKKRHRRRREENRNSSNNNSSNINNNNNMQNQNSNFGNPFGINPNQLLSMFGNIDMNQINNMLQSMGTDNIDFNNLNLGSIQNLMSGISLGSNTGMNQNRNESYASVNSDNDSDSMNDFDLEPDLFNNSGTYDDGNIQMLISLRSFVDDERKIFIDKIIKLYNEGGLN